MKAFWKLIATCFGLGYLPFMPGTWGALAGIVFFAAVKDMGLFVLLLIGILILGFIASDKVSKELGQKDPSVIVVDELAGQMIAFLGLIFSFKTVLLGFMLFRFFDIVKPFGIKKIEGLRGSSGIMTDDIVAGLYANVVTRIILVVF